MIRLTIPSIDEDDINAVREVMATGMLVQGAQVASFEQAIAKYVGNHYAVALSNCTAALHLGLLALDIHPDDLVLVTAYSWIATANVIELCHAKPIFVDINPDTYNMDPDKLDSTLKKVMTEKNVGKRVKAVIPVHTFGQMADMSAITEIAQRYNLPILEDAACALGAKWQNRQAGTWGSLGCFSFHPRKAITTGEGGIITTNDPILDQKLRSLRNHGLDPTSNTSDFVMPGYNYRLTEFQAALGLSQLKKLDHIIETRRRLAANYDKLLANTGIQTPIISPESWAIYQSYVVLLPEEIIVGNRRSELIASLKNISIETTIGTINMPMTSYFKKQYHFQPGDFPVTDAVSARSLTLPLHEKLSTTQQEEVVTALTQILSHVMGGARHGK